MTDYEKLEKLYSQIDKMIQDSLVHWSPEFIAWQANGERVLSKIFGNNSIELNSFRKLDFGSKYQTLDSQIRSCHRGLLTAKTIFKDFLDEMEEETNTIQMQKNSIKNNKIFIVHGHDEGLKYKVKDLLITLDLNPIILHEKASSCMTIIEKIEKFGSEASAAIILFTPDDVGREKTETNLKNRARQNVVFEAGLFIGILGRNRTMIVVPDNSIEMPGDLSGVVYSENSNGLEVARELKAMGFNIDMNKLF